MASAFFFAAIASTKALLVKGEDYFEATSTYLELVLHGWSAISLVFHPEGHHLTFAFHRHLNKVGWISDLDIIDIGTSNFSFGRYSFNNRISEIGACTVEKKSWSKMKLRTRFKSKIYVVNFHLASLFDSVGSRKQCLKRKSSQSLDLWKLG